MPAAVAWPGTSATSTTTCRWPWGSWPSSPQFGPPQRTRSSSRTASPVGCRSRKQLAVARSTSPRRSRQPSERASDRMTARGADSLRAAVASRMEPREPYAWMTPARRPGLRASDRAFDILGFARTGTDIPGRRADQPTGLLLLEDVSTPARRPCAREHRREHVRRYLGEVQHDRRPELDVGFEHAVWPPGAQLIECRLLQCDGHLIAGGAELLGSAAQNPRSRILRAVDPVTEAHQPLAGVKHLLDVPDRVTGPLHLLDHPEHARRRATVQRAGHRADRSGHARRDVRAGRSDDASRERRGVHAVLSGRGPIGIHSAHVAWVRLRPPADHETLDDGLRLVDLALRHHRYARPACRLRDVGEHHDGGPRQIIPRLRLVDVVQRPQAPGWSEHRDRTLDIDPDVARVHRDGERLGRRQARVELVVDEKSPDVAERDPADEILDVDASIAQRATLLVRLGDLGLESDHALESGLEVGLAHRRLLCKIKRCATVVAAGSGAVHIAAGTILNAQLRWRQRLVGYRASPWAICPRHGGSCTGIDPPRSDIHGPLASTDPPTPASMDRYPAPIRQRLHQWPATQDESAVLSG